MIEIEKPKLECVELAENYGKFVVEPLERGFGTTLGNSMRRVLLSDKTYPFLSENAAVRLADAQALAKRAGLDKKTLVSLGGQSYVLFPWLGTVSFRTLRRILKKYATELGISDIESQGCYYITFKAKKEAADNLHASIASILETIGEDAERLVGGGECPVFDKYDEYIPPHLLRIAYAKDRLLEKEIIERLDKGEEVYIESGAANDCITGYSVKKYKNQEKQ